MLRWREGAREGGRLGCDTRLSVLLLRLRLWLMKWDPYHREPVTVTTALPHHWPECS